MGRINRPLFVLGRHETSNMAGSRFQQDCIPIAPTGLTVLHEPSDTEPSLDVVFVHGFTGHPERTWTHKNGEHDLSSEPPSKTPKRNLFSTPHKQAVFWPRDLLPETLPDARIFTYDHDTNLRHKVIGPPLNKSLVYDMANDFLVELAGHRTDHIRPTLFIAHSLGGVMVKEALRQSSHQLQDDLKSIFHSTIGIIFFGTPHRGADPRGFFLHTFEAIIKAVGVSANEHVVATLLPDSERLKQLKDEFDPVIRQQNWRVHSFQEGLGIQALRGCKVVDDSSSYLGLPDVEMRQHIGRNHMDICRFTGKNDSEYQKVVQAVIRITKDVASNVAPTTQVRPNEMSEELREKLRASLRSSKRTTMIYFFNARGADLEKTTKGMYRSLLLQLLEKLPHLYSIFDSERFGAWKADEESHEWPIASLEELFEDAILALGSSPVTCFIDALDECDETEIRHMVRQFQHIGEQATVKGIHFRIFLSSRYYPQITINKCLCLELDGQDCHEQDIDAYINSELQAGSGKTKLELREKSAGVFMWVVLVVDILNKTQFYYALHSMDSDSETLTSAVSISEIGGFVRYTSKGPAEITKSKSPVVQFIHESVRDFLLKEKGLLELWPSLAQNLTGFEAQSHETLKQCCLEYLGLDVSQSLDLSYAKLPKVSLKDSVGITLRERAIRQFPFLDYATKNILLHADGAQACSIRQKDFVQRYALGPWFNDWLRLHNIVQKHGTRRYRDTLDTTPLYVLAELDLPQLITLCLQSCHGFLNKEEERYMTPLLAAMVRQSYNAVDLFVESLAASHNACEIETKITLEDWKSQEKRIKLSRDFAVKRETIQHEDEILTRLLLRFCITDINSMDNAGRTPLSYAAEGGHVSICNLLLKHGANFNLAAYMYPRSDPPIIRHLQKAEEEEEEEKTGSE
ncbi:hypothetical protein QBC38DRAFT_549429 [Podospora fimiseda]|uniref:Nephrocystin 3-like N-terminal domain-containing protein n=1 Tax=Podospora fimiseda TaxID=252190 RepID=A0AAN6YNW3_9PEZI|nr:hypothetical protein QBC38DRAFT_549429 [Podospora fimiseda]